MKNIKKSASIFCSIALLTGVLLPNSTFATIQDINLLHLGSVSDGQNGARLSGASDVFVSGDYAYVTARTSDTLEIIDVTDPLYPSLVGSLAHGDGGANLDGAWSVVVHEGYAYVTAKDGDALQVIDVSDPENPVAVATIEDGDGGAALDAPIDVDIEGDYAYVASYVSDALEIIDISDPENPTHIATFYDGQAGAMLDGASDVLVDGNYAYVTSQWSNALEIINISTPEYPTHVGVISHPVFLRQARSVAIRGSYAYVTARSKLALQVIDISDRENPVFVGSLGNDDSGEGAKLNDPNSIIIEDDVAYITSYRSSAIEMVDISDPDTPVHAAHITHGIGGANLEYPNSIFYSGGLIYATSAYEPGILEIISPNPNPDIVVSPSNYDFGDVLTGQSITKTFRVTNTGFLGLEIGSFTLINDTDFSITNNTCDNSPLDVRDECTFDVTFSAESEGLHSGVIGIMNNVESKNPIIVQTQGNIVLEEATEESAEQEAEEGKGNKIVICHMTGEEGGGHTIEINVNALQSHLSHGDYIGACEDGEGIDIEVALDDSLSLFEEADMTVKVLGVSITFGVDGPNVPVKLETTIGDDTYTIFHGTEPEVDPDTPFTLSDIPENSIIHFSGTSYNPYWEDAEIYSVDTQESSPLVIALRNGDSVPENTPANQQPSIESFLDGYIDAFGNVTIGENEVIYLFELGTSNPNSSSADFQDAVFLVTFE